MRYHLCMEIRDITKDAVVIHEEASFREAIALMINRQTNSLLVVNDEGVLTGEVNVSDLLDAIVPEYLDGDDISARFATEEMFKNAVIEAQDKLVGEFMTTDFAPVSLNDSLLTIAATAIAHQTAHIPIMDVENKPIGFISRRGLKHILGDCLEIKEN